MSITIPRPGDIWKDYLNNYCEVVGIAQDAKLGRQHVIYRSEDGCLSFIALGRWGAVITLKGGQQVQRFTLVARSIEPEERQPHDDTQPAPPVCTPVNLDTEVVFA